jgi:hypothetical protein
VAGRPTHDEERGVVFPRGSDGRRSTTATGRGVFADAARAVDPELAAAIEREADWRKGYAAHARRLVAAEVRSSDPLAVAEAGLASLHARFEFVRDGERQPLPAAFEQADPAPLRTVTVRGAGTSSRPALSVPYRGERLRGDALHRQLDRWVDAGAVEPSFAEAVRRVDANPDWLDLSDRTIAVIGAGSEMGPLPALCGWRANVLAVDLPRADISERLIATARAGNGTVHFPALGRQTGERTDAGEAETADAVGADLLTRTPELAAWLAQADGPLTVGNYVYADGADHVRVAMAVDAMQSHLTSRRDDVSLAVLATPTEVYAVPEALVDDVRRRARARRVPLHERVARAASRGRLYAPAYTDLVITPEGRRFGFADSQVVQQGPNYALAKRLQRWRALVARAHGIRSSINVAPATTTRSVTRNRILAAAYAGAHRFGVEVFAPETSNALMAALLVHDLRCDDSSANPAWPLDHPLDLYVLGAAHGGLWRAPWTPPTVLGVAAVTGLVTGRARRVGNA